MEYLSSSTSLPDGLTVFPWMSVRAANVTTNSLSLVANGVVPPRITGIPATRMLFVKNYATNDDIDIVFPIDEQDVPHPIATPPIDGVAWNASDPNHLSADFGHLDILGFRRAPARHRL